MFTIDPLWVYIAVPAALVSILILIKLRQKEVNKTPTELPSAKREEVQTSEDKDTKESPNEIKEAQTAPETEQKIKPHGCLNYLGYLYMKKAPNEAHIPTECYNCHDLLKCLYSPVVVEKVYGEQNSIK